MGHRSGECPTIAPTDACWDGKQAPFVHRGRQVIYPTLATTFIIGYERRATAGCDLRDGMPMEETSLTTILAEKAAIEREITDGASDPSQQGQIFTKLRALNRICVGTLAFRWPGFPHPLYFRCGTTDLSNFAQIFIHDEYGAALPNPPSRIFDLGGYVGYATAYLANKYPDAQIVTVEPSPDNFRVNTLNTAPFGNVRRINAGVGGQSGFLSAGIPNNGDWSATFALGTEAEGSVRSYSLADLMKEVNWNRFDFLKCDIEGMEREVFGQARDLIAANVDVCAVEVHDTIAPGAERAVYDCFDIDKFDRFKNGEFHYFIRNKSNGHALLKPEILILKPPSGLREIKLVNVPNDAWGYYLFEGDSCQIHPADRYAAPSMLNAQVELSGQTTFESEVSVVNPMDLPVKFIFQLAKKNEASPLLTREYTVAAGMRSKIVVETQPLYGAYEIILATQMAPNAYTNHKASANWHHPMFR